MKEAKYRRTSTDYFRKINGTWFEIVPEQEEDPYGEVLRAFANACLGRGQSVADGREGRKSLLMSNAAYLSSWEHRMVEIPEIGSESERVFEEKYEDWLRKKMGE